MSENGEHFKKMVLLFLGVSLSIGLLVTLVLSWQVGLIFGGLIGLFVAVHLGRSLTSETFEINMTNKDPMKGFAWYEDEIVAHMKDMRYSLETDGRDLKIWWPSVRGRVMGGEFKMEKTPYSLTITGPRGTVRIMKSILEINKIFL